MAQLPADRTKLALAQSNQIPQTVASSSRNINAMAEAYDTIDLLNEKVNAHSSDPVLPHPDGSVTAAKLATDSVETAKIKANNVTTAKLADGSVTTAKLSDGSVTTEKQANSSVTTDKLANGSVTNAKVANSTLTADKFVSGALTNDTQNALRVTALEKESYALTKQTATPKIEVVAHRGFATFFPENTIPAITGAFANGADTVEIDILHTSDGRLVLMHDLTVNRTTNGTGTVSELTLSYIQSLDAGSWFSTEWTGTKVPTFEDALKEARGKGELQIECKELLSASQVQNIVNIITSYNMERHVMIISGYIANLAKVRDYSSIIEIGLLSNSPDFMSTMAGYGKAAYLMSYATIETTPTLITQARELGLDVGTYTIATLNKAMDMVDLGVKRITTDIPLEGTY